ILHLPHFPNPHFIRFSRVVMIFSSLNPSFSKIGKVYLIIRGGPHKIAIVSLAEGDTFSTIVGTKPISHFQSGVSPPGSTVTIVLIPDIDFQSSISFL